MFLTRRILAAGRSVWASPTNKLNPWFRSQLALRSSVCAEYTVLVVILNMFIIDCYRTW